MHTSNTDIARTLIESTAWRRVRDDPAGQIEQIVYALNVAQLIVLDKAEAASPDPPEAWSEAYRAGWIASTAEYRIALRRLIAAARNRE